jgi:hypothetical protein
MSGKRLWEMISSRFRCGRVPPATSDTASAVDVSGRGARVVHGSQAGENIILGDVHYHLASKEAPPAARFPHLEFSDGPVISCYYLVIFGKASTL